MQQKRDINLIKFKEMNNTLFSELSDNKAKVKLEITRMEAKENLVSLTCSFKFINYR